MKAAFTKAAKFMKSPVGLALGTALLGTTALMSGNITSTLGTAAVAGASLGLSLKVLIDSSSLVLQKAKLLGRVAKIPTAVLGSAIGIVASIPEFATSVSSIAQKTGDLGIGTIVGGNIAHILLILGGTAAVGGIARSQGASWKFNAASMTAATFGFGAMLATNTLNTCTGLGLAGAGMLYAGGKYITLKRDSKKLDIPMEELIHDHSDHEHGHGYHHHGHGHHGHEHHDHSHDHDKSTHHGYKSFHKCDDDHGDCNHGKPRLFNLPKAEPEPAPPAPTFTWKDAGLGILGTGGLIAAATVLPHSAVTLSTMTHIDQAALGAIVLGLATSAPELAVNIRAGLEKDTDFVVSNVLTCNIAGIFFVGSTLALGNTPVSPAFSPDTPLGLFNLAALGASTVAMGATLLANKGGIKKWQGFAAAALYTAYMAGSAALGSVTPHTHTESTSITIKAKTPVPGGLPSPVPAISS